VLFPWFGKSEHTQGLAVVDSNGRPRWLTHDPMEEDLVVTPGAHSALVERVMPTGILELVDVPLDGSPSASQSQSGIAARKGLALAPDGRRVVWSTCSAIAELAVVDARGQLSRTPQPDDHVEGISSIPGTQLLAVVSAQSGTEKVWIEDLSGHTPSRTVPLSEIHPQEIAVSSDGRLFVVSIAAKGLFVGNLAAGDSKLRQVTSDPLDSQPSFRFGNLEVLFTRRLPNGTRRVFGVPVDGGEPVPVLGPQTDGAAASPVADRLVYLDGAVMDAVPIVEDVPSGARHALSRMLQPGQYAHLRFSMDGSRVVLARGSTEIDEVDVTTGAILRVVKDPGGSQLTNVTYTPSGLAVVRVQWRGNIWAADAVLHE
jgi:hypothetical protein